MTEIKVVDMYKPPVMDITYEIDDVRVQLFVRKEHIKKGEFYFEVDPPQAASPELIQKIKEKLAADFYV